jgi:hypothetical protein
MQNERNVQVKKGKRGLKGAGQNQDDRLQSGRAYIGLVTDLAGDSTHIHVEVLGVWVPLEQRGQVNPGNDMARSEQCTCKIYGW